MLGLSTIFVLSTQDGEQTVQTSLTITKQIAEAVFTNPTDAQIADLHMVLRKAAHLVLFFLLGSLTTWISAVTFPKTKGILRGLYLVFSALLSVCCGYLDEWHKQFISGRHFDYSETLLNMKSGIAGVCFAFAVLMIYRIVKECMEDS